MLDYFFIFIQDRYSSLTNHSVPISNLFSINIFYVGLKDIYDATSNGTLALETTV